MRTYLIEQYKALGGDALLKDGLYMDVSMNETWLIHNKERINLSMLTLIEALRASGMTFEEAIQMFNGTSKTQTAIPKEEKKVIRNCTNCGAPLTYSCVCEYCGTVY